VRQFSTSAALGLVRSTYCTFGFGMLHDAWLNPLRPTETEPTDWRIAILSRHTSCLWLRPLYPKLLRLRLLARIAVRCPWLMNRIVHHHRANLSPPNCRRHRNFTVPHSGRPDSLGQLLHQCGTVDRGLQRSVSVSGHFPQSAATVSGTGEQKRGHEAVRSKGH
jgi:hypothetical protein